MFRSSQEVPLRLLDRRQLSLQAEFHLQRALGMFAQDRHSVLLFPVADARHSRRGRQRFIDFATCPRFFHSVICNRLFWILFWFIYFILIVLISFFYLNLTKEFPHICCWNSGITKSIWNQSIEMDCKCKRHVVVYYVTYSNIVYTFILWWHHNDMLVTIHWCNNRTGLWQLVDMEADCWQLGTLQG